MVFAGLVNSEAEKKQRSEYAEFSTQSMCKAICPMDEYGESRTFESFYGENDKKWPVHMPDVSACGKLHTLKVMWWCGTTRVLVSFLLLLGEVWEVRLSQFSKNS